MFQKQEISKLKLAQLIEIIQFFNLDVSLVKRKKPYIDALAEFLMSCQCQN